VGESVDGMVDRIAVLVQVELCSFKWQEGRFSCRCAEIITRDKIE
jgi:hypothetical protein